MRLVLIALVLSTISLAALPKNEFQKQEETPVFAAGIPETPAAAREARAPAWGMLVGIVAFLVASAGIFFALKALQRRTTGGGNRRYLIESLSYCPVGPGGKAGLSLVKIGNEFVLVGVTAQQVTMLSTLPELKARYENESKYERGTFSQAVQEELAKAVKRPEGTA